MNINEDEAVPERNQQEHILALLTRIIKRQRDVVESGLMVHFVSARFAAEVEVMLQQVVGQLRFVMLLAAHVISVWIGHILVLLEPMVAQ